VKWYSNYLFGPGGKYAFTLMVFESFTWLTPETMVGLSQAEAERLIDLNCYVVLTIRNRANADMFISKLKEDFGDVQSHVRRQLAIRPPLAVGDVAYVTSERRPIPAKCQILRAPTRAKPTYKVDQQPPSPHPVPTSTPSLHCNAI
jgi:hypothetical protein